MATLDIPQPASNISTTTVSPAQTTALEFEHLSSNERLDLLTVTLSEPVIDVVFREFNAKGWANVTCLYTNVPKKVLLAFSSDARSTLKEKQKQRWCISRGAEAAVEFLMDWMAACCRKRRVLPLDIYDISGQQWLTLWETAIDMGFDLALDELARSAWEKAESLNFKQAVEAWEAAFNYDVLAPRKAIEARLLDFTCDDSDSNTPYIWSMAHFALAHQHRDRRGSMSRLEHAKDLRYRASHPRPSPLRQVLSATDECEMYFAVEDELPSMDTSKDAATSDITAQSLSPPSPRACQENSLSDQPVSGSQPGYDLPFMAHQNSPAVKRALRPYEHKIAIPKLPFPISSSCEKSQTGKYCISSVPTCQTSLRAYFTKANLAFESSVPMPDYDLDSVDHTGSETSSDETNSSDTFSAISNSSALGSPTKSHFELSQMFSGDWSDEGLDTAFNHALQLQDMETKLRVNII